MEIFDIADAPAYDPERFVALPFAEGKQSNARLIRLAPGQELPPHTHGTSDLFLYAVEGEATLETDDGPVALGTGALAVLGGEEELRAANRGASGVTLLAFLAPPFPPRG